MNVSEEIKRLHDLHLAGALSEAEFAQAKAKLLSSINLDKPDSTSGSAAGSGPANDLVQELSRLRRSRNDRWLGGVCGGL